MAALYVIIAVLVGAVIILFIQSREKPRELEKEVSRLRRQAASEGLSFEQLEYRISALKEDVAAKRNTIKKSRSGGRDMGQYLEKIEKDLDGILQELLSSRSVK